MNPVEGLRQPSNEPSPDSADSSSYTQSTYSRTSCDLCKRMKIKCEKQGEGCTHCIARGVKCETTLVKRKKQAKRSNALHNVEGRIKRIESLLLASGLNADTQFAEADSDAEAEPAANLTDKLSMLLISKEGSARFVGPSSGLSLFSPQGLQWISERTGSSELSEYITRMAQKKSPFQISQTEVWHPMSPLDREPLPPKELADQYVERYFETFNLIFPLYDKTIFLGHYKLQYSGSPIGGTPWYASLNIILCLGSMIMLDDQRQNELPLAEDNNFRARVGWKYFRNATSCFLDLQFGESSLMAVQSICGMIFIQQINLDPHPVNVLIAAAGRIAHGIGLHRKLDDFGLSQAEINLRRNLFWILYFLDKNISLRCGQPSVLVDDDIGVDPPQEEGALHAFPDGSQKFNILKLHTQLASIESRIYSELYSIRGRNRPEFERLKSVGQLDKALTEWRDSIPIEVRPQEPINCLRDQFVPVVILHFTYLNALTTIHRASVNHGSWINVGSRLSGSEIHDQRLNPRVYSSHSICLSAARNSIELLQRVSNVSPRNNVLWMTIYFTLSSFLILFANILQGNVQDSHIESDLKLMDLAITFISPPKVPLSPFSCASPSMDLFLELNKAAKKFVQKASNRNTKKTKRAREQINSEQSEWQELETTSKEVNNLADPVLASLSNNPTTLITHTSYENATPANDLSNPSSYDVQAQQNLNDLQYSQQSFNPFPIGMSEPLPDESLLSGDHLPLPLDMASLPLFSNTFEWDLANLWNFNYVPEN